MRRAVVVLLVVAGAVRAEPPAEVVAVEKHVQKVITAAERSVACVLVSRSDRYADYHQAPSAAKDGQLGGFNPPALTRGLTAAERELVRRLDLANPETVPEAFGSGVVIEPPKEGGDGRGLILTNYHVIANATKIYVRLPGGASRGSYADILAADQRADLAVLKLIHRIDGGVKPILLGDGGKVRKGDLVVSLANPFAAGFRDGSPSASWGIIANVRRRVGGRDRDRDGVRPLTQYATLLQTDVRLNLGCSGGALVNMDGELVGLTTATAGLVGGEAPGGYAIPIDANTRKMIKTLAEGREIEYGFLGVSINPEDRNEEDGVMIQEATPGMPAARFGLRRGDVIVAINGNPVREPDDLFLNISAAQAGEVAKITVRGKPRPVEAHLTKSPILGEMAVIASNKPKPVFGLRVDYLSTMTSSPYLPEGVMVKEVEPGSPAGKKFKDPLSRAIMVVITAVDGQPVTKPDEFYRLASGKGSITLDVAEMGDDRTPARTKVTVP
jgi:serine protease Do